MILTELAKVEKPDDRLDTIAFKQRLYFHSTFSQKLNKKNYDYATLAMCFDVADYLTDWDD